ncbi:MAG TPA: PhoU domain-containing protein [Acidimicrobiales bacterium]|nr:PhoU domain-containing protein [Acidimicrobiales bacterium]
MDAGPLRSAFYDELDQIRLQVELMGVRVDQNLERMREVLRTGDEAVAAAALAADDDIDAMHVSLLERCYDLLGRESPVASDLRFVVSVVRILSELERVGDLALRVVKLASYVDAMSQTGETWDVLLTMVDTAVEQYRTALRAWSSQDLALAVELVEHAPPLFAFQERLIGNMRFGGDSDSVRLLMSLFVIAQAADRIADHAAIIGARLRYLITGEPAHLAAEVR